MNSEQLKKINELVENVKKIECLLKSSELYDIASSTGLLQMPKRVIEPTLIAYRDELKQELNELGYEE
jgi:hypothetical protein